MKTEQIQQAYEVAKARYADLGIDTEAALAALQKVSLSLHCWQADDVTGFENQGGDLTGGIQATGNYPGKARNIEELRADILKAKSFIPGRHRLNLHEIYGEFGGEFVEVVLTGDTFDQANAAAVETCEREGKTFIPPFNDPKIIEGQGTVGLEILQQSRAAVDYIFVPIGGGGLASGIGSVYKQMSPQTKIIGVEPAGAAGMKLSFERGEVTELDRVEKFVDGAAVQRVGDLTFDICRQTLDDIVVVPEGKVCTTILNLYNFDAIVVEPAGALSISALDLYRDKIEGKNVVCVVSGSNNDIVRMEDIKERSLLYEGLKHYFVVRFPQRAGALQNFVSNVLGPHDDITYFEYKKKTNREKGPVLIGIELQSPDDFEGLTERMKRHDIDYEYLNANPNLFEFLIG